MNILFFYRIYPEFGGVEVVTTILSNRFVQDGCNVVIASIEQPHLEIIEQLDHRIKLVKLDYPVISFKNIKRLNKIIVDNKIDIVINQWGLPYKSTVLCNAAIKGTKCKLISVLHGSPYTSKVLLKAKANYENKNLLLKPIFYTKYKIIDKVIRYSIKYNVKHTQKYVLLSHSFIKPLMTYAHLKDDSNITAIGNPITIEVKKELIDVGKKKKQLLYVGRMDLTNKNVDRIVKAWEDIWRKHLDWELILVGDGPDKEALMNYTNDHQIGNIRFEGFQKEPPIKYYANAAVFLLTSDLEGFGLVVIESMSYGAVPIVYGSYEAIYDIIENGKSGFIISQPFSPQELEQKIELLISNDDMREKMGHNAIERAKIFKLDSIIEHWYTLFKEVAKN